MATDRLMDEAVIIGEELLDRIPIAECGEPLLPLESFCRRFESRMNSQRSGYNGGVGLYARKTVCEMLANAEQNLPSGLKFGISDAYRPIEYQSMRFNNLLCRIQSENPRLSEPEARKKAFVYIFPPNVDPQKPPAHSTGGALDLTLLREDGTQIDMGCNIGEFNDQTTPTYSRFITPTKRENRTLLLGIMGSAGFTNYPGEFWHFMYGDREWAAYTGKSSSIYGRADLIMDTKDIR